MEYLNSPSKLHDFIPRVGFRSLGLGMPGPPWLGLNCLQVIECFWLSMHKWGLAE